MTVNIDFDSLFETAAKIDAGETSSKPEAQTVPDYTEVPSDQDYRETQLNRPIEFNEAHDRFEVRFRGGNEIGEAANRIMVEFASLGFSNDTTLGYPTPWCISRDRVIGSARIQEILELISPGFRDKFLSTEPKTTETEDSDKATVRHNVELSGVEIDFHGVVPDPELRNAMRETGMRWKRGSSYWYIRVDAIGTDARDLILEFDPYFIIPDEAPCHRSERVQEALAPQSEVARPDELLSQYQRQIDTAAELWECSKTDAMLRLVDLGYRAMMRDQSEQ